MPEKISVTSVYDVLSDEQTQGLLDSIVNTQDPDSEILLAKLQLTKRKYYDRIGDLIAAGLIRRYKGKYRLSSFGKIMLGLQRTAKKAAENYWKLEAIDSIKTFGSSNLTEVEYMKVVDLFLDDLEIKDAYLYNDRHYHHSLQKALTHDAMRSI